MPEVLEAQSATLPTIAAMTPQMTCRVAVIWIDWYAYHIARFRGIDSAPSLSGRVVGLELVGGVGVHAGLRFREELPRDLPVQTILPNGNWQSTSKIRLAREVWHRLSHLKPEVVLVPGYYNLPALAAAVWAKVHRRTSVLMTESTASDHSRQVWKERAKSLLIRGLFDWAVAGGNAHVRYLSVLGFPHHRIARYYDVVENELYREASALLRSRGANDFSLPQHYFLYVGRLAQEKNVDGLLTSWLKYRAGGGTWSLVLAGDGPERAALGSVAQQSAYAEEVHFAGHKGSRELLPFYAFAECFVLPSRREPWGLVVNEAMASELPVIVSSRCGCAEDLVRADENGFIFDPNAGSEELSGLLLRVEQLEPSRRRAMGKRSAAIIADYSPKHFGQEIAAIAHAAMPGSRVGS